MGLRGYTGRDEVGDVEDTTRTTMDTSGYAAFAPHASRCTVCRHPNAVQIDLMLLGYERHPKTHKRMTHADIVEFAKPMGSIKPSALGRHYNNHTLPSWRTYAEVREQMRVLDNPTGRRLGLHGAFASIVTAKILGRVSKLGDDAFKDADITQLLRVALLAGQNSINIEKTESELAREIVAERVGVGMKNKGLSPEAIEIAQREILGME